MSSKRALRRRSCEGKQKHSRLSDAVAHLRSLAASGYSVGEVHPYRCAFCRSWHVGHIQAFDRDAQPGHRGRRL
jgi:hypothetical protein